MIGAHSPFWTNGKLSRLNRSDRQLRCNTVKVRFLAADTDIYVSININLLIDVPY
jgi:hypothetical protein